MVGSGWLWLVVDCGNGCGWPWLGRLAPAGRLARTAGVPVKLVAGLDWRGLGNSLTLAPSLGLEHALCMGYMGGPHLYSNTRSEVATPVVAPDEFLTKSI